MGESLAERVERIEREQNVGRSQALRVALIERRIEQERARERKEGNG